MDIEQKVSDFRASLEGALGNMTEDMGELIRQILIMALRSLLLGAPLSDVMLANWHLVPPMDITLLYSESYGQDNP